MTKFEVDITEIHRYSVRVEAASENEAEEVASSFFYERMSATGDKDEFFLADDQELQAYVLHDQNGSVDVDAKAWKEGHTL